MSFSVILNMEVWRTPGGSWRISWLLEDSWRNFLTHASLGKIVSWGFQLKNEKNISAEILFFPLFYIWRFRGLLEDFLTTRGSWRISWLLEDSWRKFLTHASLGKIVSGGFQLKREKNISPDIWVFPLFWIWRFGRLLEAPGGWSGVNQLWRRWFQAISDPMEPFPVEKNDI